jgi:uncharacterized protein YecE (DUF72 family)
VQCLKQVGIKFIIALLVIIPVNNTFYSGTSGLVLPIIRSDYPPEFHGKSRLEYYASLFTTIEINSSFYKLPRASTIIKWADGVPPTFQFTFKLSKAITHVKGLNFNADDVEIFMHIIDHIGNKSGCVLIQLPPALKTEHINQLEKLLKSIKKFNTNKWKIAVEFRNKTWYNDEVNYLLRQYNISLVMHDLPAAATPFTMLTTEVIYLRFHGTEKGYRGNYPTDVLLEYARRIKSWTNQGKTVYCYFNNTLGNAINNLQTLNHFLL